MNQTTSKQYVISDLVMLLHDEPQEKGEEKTEILEAYFNDIYKLFLAKLARFEAAPTIEEKDKKKLRSLLDEMINVKSLLVD
jgi:uncharacterized protein with PIN domain